MPGFGLAWSIVHDRNEASVVDYGQLAQLVEQRIENPRVLGSIPRLATSILTASRGYPPEAVFHLCGPEGVQVNGLIALPCLGYCGRHFHKHPADRTTSEVLHRFGNKIGYPPADSRPPPSLSRFGLARLDQEQLHAARMRYSNKGRRRLLTAQSENPSLWSTYGPHDLNMPYR